VLLALRSLYESSGPPPAEPIDTGVLVWPVRANARDETIEEYGYLTSILTAHDGSEQRIQRRRHPVGALEFSYACLNVTHAQASMNLLYAHRADRWVVPHWYHPRRLLGDVGAGATTIGVATPGAPFQDPLGLGLYVVLWKDPRTYEALPIDAVSVSNITLQVGPEKNWPAATTYVFPARVGILTDAARPQWDSSKVLTGRLRFTFDAVEEELVISDEGAIHIFGDVVEPVGG